jgi:hypothetical protein
MRWRRPGWRGDGKIATDGELTRAARQLPNGKWTSKLGRWQDIEHELDGLVGAMYGTVRQILKRAIT